MKEKTKKENPLMQNEIEIKKEIQEHEKLVNDNLNIVKENTENINGVYSFNGIDGLLPANNDNQKENGINNTQTEFKKPRKQYTKRALKENTDQQIVEKIPVTLSNKIIDGIFNTLAVAFSDDEMKLKDSELKMIENGFNDVLNDYGMNSKTLNTVMLITGFVVILTPRTAKLIKKAKDKKDKKENENKI